MTQTTTKATGRKDLRVLTDVKDLSDWLNGAGVEQAQLRPGAGGLQLVVRLVRAMPERQTTVRHGLFRRMKTPWSKCHLTLSRVQSATVRRVSDMAPDEAPLLRGEAVAGGYELTVQAPDGLQVIVRMDQLEGSFTDVGEVIDSP